MERAAVAEAVMSGVVADGSARWKQALPSWLNGSSPTNGTLPGSDSSLKDCSTFTS
jgi:hypothetical protein